MIGYYAPRHHPAYDEPMDPDNPLDLLLNNATGETALRIATTPGVVSIAILLDPEALRYFAEQVNTVADDAERAAVRDALRRQN